MRVGEQDECPVWLEVTDNVVGGAGRPVGDDVPYLKVLPGRDDPVGGADLITAAACPGCSRERRW